MERVKYPLKNNSILSCSYKSLIIVLLRIYGRNPFNQNSDRSDWEKWSTSKGGPLFSKLFRLDWSDPLRFGPKFPEILVEWIAPYETPIGLNLPPNPFLNFPTIWKNFRSLTFLPKNHTHVKQTRLCSKKNWKDPMLWIS